ncbi:MAG: shikimate dehydrogenase [Egibacteraceae bacterium]
MRLPVASTDLVCLLGHPVAHSVSPQIHNAAFAAAGVDAVYVAFDVAPAAVAAAVAGLRALGALGANVTVPHKRAVWEQADGRTPEAELIGAANTLFWRTDFRTPDLRTQGLRGGGDLIADNTDARGLQAVLEADVHLEAGDPVLLFGAGGAARAAAVALGRIGARVRVEARRAEAARVVADLAASCGASRATADEPPRCVINATPLGLHGEPLPDHLMALGPGQVALDLVYGPVDTPFLAAARARGAAAFDGLGMLVAQAGLAFTRWTGLAPPIKVMRAAAASALRR